MYKYAKDCYNLQLYLHGDDTAPIDEIFRPMNLSKNQSQPVYSNRSELAETKTMIQSLKEELLDMKKQTLETTKELKVKINVLEQNYEDLSDKHEKLEAVFNSKLRFTTQP